MKFKEKNYRKTIAFISIGTFICSLPMDCISTGKDTGYPSWFALVLGWFSIASGNLMIISWLANPLIFLSWIFMFINSKKLALLTGATATILCVTFLSFETIVVNEAGGLGKIEGYGLGYNLWLISAGIIFVGNLGLILMENNKKSGLQ